MGLPYLLYILFTLYMYSTLLYIWRERPLITTTQLLSGPFSVCTYLAVAVAVAVACSVLMIKGLTPDPDPDAIALTICHTYNAGVEIPRTPQERRCWQY